MIKRILLFLCFHAMILFRTLDVQAEYIDPSIMTYSIQAIAGLVIGLGTFFGIYYRKLFSLFRSDDSKQKESDRLIFQDPDGTVRTPCVSWEDIPEEKPAKEDFLVAVLLSLSMGFLLCVYKPLEVFFLNLSEFSFDFVSILPYLLILFLIISGVELIVHFFCFCVSKKMYVLSVVAAFGFWLAFLIQGNILIKDLPESDGGGIDWSLYTVQYRQSLILWVTVFALVVLLFVLLKKKGCFLLVKCITTAGSLVLLCTLLIIGFRNNGFRQSIRLRVTTEGLNSFSDDRNFLILIPDMVDSMTFQKLLEGEDPEYRDIFEDFTYYPDTLGCYPHTRYSLPEILTGELYKRQELFEEFFDSAVDRSVFLGQLEELGYRKTVFHAGDIRYGSHPEQFVNVKEKGFEFENPREFMLDILRMTFFYHMPYQLKHYEQYAIYNLTHEKEKDAFEWRNDDFYEYLLTHPAEIKDKKAFQIIHFEGAHTPYRYDKDLNIIIGTEKASYEGNVEATVTVMEQYLQNLRTAGIYDQCVIIIMSDHGYNNGKTEGKQNPLFMIKGYKESHPFEINNAPLSYTNLQEIYSHLLNGETAEETIHSLALSKTRLYYYYEHVSGSGMKELITEGKAWDTDALVPTGLEFSQEP